MADRQTLNPLPAAKLQAAAHTDCLSAAPVLAAKVQAALNALGLDSPQRLQHCGAAAAFLLLKKSGLTVTRSVLWQLDAAARGVPLAQIDETRKNELLRCLKTHPPVALFPPLAQMEKWMRFALDEARAAQQREEIPVGAAVVHNGQIIARAHNRCIEKHFVGAHAEMLAIAEAGRRLGTYRLQECDLYVTLEPCAMCMGALLQARIARLVFAADEPKSGASGSVIDLAHSPLNTHTAVYKGICGEESRLLLRHFFHEKRCGR